MKFSIYETRHLVSQYEMKVINEVCPITEKKMKFKTKREDEWIETTGLFFSRYVKTYTGGFNSPEDRKIAFFAYECLYMYTLMGSGHTRARTNEDPNIQVIIGSVNDTNDYKLIVFEPDGTGAKQIDDISKQHNLNTYSIRYFDLYMHADDMEKYANKVYIFTVKDNEDRTFGVHLTEPEPGMRYTCTLEEVCEDEKTTEPNEEDEENEDEVQNS